MNLVETFKQEEIAKLNRIDKLFRNHPAFFSSNDITYSLKLKNTDKPFIVKPSVLRRLFAIVFICGGLYFWLTLAYMIFQNILLPVTIVFLVLTTAWISMILWAIFLDPKQSYKIIIEKDSIKLGNQSIDWNQITDYLLMVKGGGKNEVTTLVLFIDNTEIRKYNLTNLNKSGKEIMKTIEFYKLNSK